MENIVLLAGNATTFLPNGTVVVTTEDNRKVRFTIYSGKFVGLDEEILLVMEGEMVKYAFKLDDNLKSK